MDVFMQKLCVPDEIEQALEKGAALSISVSGGKDSDATAVLLQRLHREQYYPGPIELVHCDMGRSEWNFTAGYVTHRAAMLDLPLTIVCNPDRDLQDLFVQRSQKRPDVPLWPSAAQRYCTSAKTNEIDKHLRHWGGKYGTVISAIGLRAAESPARAKKPIWTVRETITTRDRTGLTWSPLHHFSTEEVWEVLGVTQTELTRVRTTVQAIRAAGGSVDTALAETNWFFHPAYALGSERLSCSICILASKSDLLVGIEHNPHYYADLVDLEIQTGWSFQPGRFVGELRPDLLTVQQQQSFSAMLVHRAERQDLASQAAKNGDPVSTQPRQLRLL